MLNLTTNIRHPPKLFERAPRSFSSVNSKSIQRTSKYSPQQSTHRSTKSNHIKTFVRFRPLSLHQLEMTNSCINVNFPSNQTVNINGSSFQFQKVFIQSSTQAEVFEYTTRHLIHNFVEGYDSTLMAYGQTGSGKTFTMFGDHRKGIIPLAGEEIFRRLEGKFVLKCSVLQIYNQAIVDLLNAESKQRKTPITTLEIKSCEQLCGVITKCHEMKKVRSTTLNDNSSRSHIIFTLYLEQFIGQQATKSRFSLVDLAGSERIDKSNPSDISQTKKINLSLSCLVKTIKALIKKQPHIPFRESKLTKVLKQSLTGYLSLIITCSSHSSCLNQTLNSIRFGVQSKRLETVSTKNVTTNNESTVQKVLYDSLKSELENYEEKMGRIKQILHTAKSTGVQNRYLNQISHVLDATILKQCRVFNSIKIPNSHCSQDSIYSQAVQSLNVKNTEITNLQKQISTLKSQIEDYKTLIQPLPKQQKTQYLLFEKEVLMCQIEQLQNKENVVDVKDIRGKDQYIRQLQKKIDVYAEIIKKCTEDPPEKKVLKVKKIIVDKK